MLGAAEQYFLAVAKAGSFTKASKELFVSQPAISMQIQKLENELGFPLFTRTTRLVQLTPQGKLLYDVLDGNNEAWVQAIKTAHQLTAILQDKNYLRIGVPNGWGICRPPISIINLFQKLHPELKIIVHQYNYKELTQKLHDHELDLILTIKGELAPYALEFGWRCCRSNYEIVFLLSSKNPASKTQNPANEMAGPVFALDNSTSITCLNSIQKILEERKWNMPIVPLPNLDTIIASVDSGEGCTFVNSCARICDSFEYKIFHYDIKASFVFAWQLDQYNQTTNLFLNEFEQLSAKYILH